jgi:hypothetical protein
MFSLNTRAPTICLYDYIMDPSIIEEISLGTKKKRDVTYYHHTETSPKHDFIKDICSSFLTDNGFKHNKEEWFMDVIRYNLDEDTKRVESGLAWHCENDNYPNVITVLMYLRIDETLIDANIRYKDREGVKQVIPLKSGTTIIMDGDVPHKPQDPYGTGRRDLIIMSFKKE